MKAEQRQKCVKSIRAKKTCLARFFISGVGSLKFAIDGSIKEEMTMPLMEVYDKEHIKQSILGKLQRYDGCTLEEATPQQIYKAVASTIRDQIMKKWCDAKQARKD